MRRFTTPLLVLAAAFTLAGCSSSGYSDFDREATDADVLPGYVDVAVDEGSVRHAGSNEGVDVYLARSGSELCIALVVDLDDWGVACGEGFPMSAGNSRVQVHLVADGIPGDDAWEKLSENVFVEKRP